MSRKIRSVSASLWIAPVWGGLVVGLEYRHYDFRTEQVTPVNAVGVGVLVDTYDTQTKFDAFTFRATYLFSPK
jgi:hypothetical protein